MESAPTIAWNERPRWLEYAVEHIQRDVADMKSDLRGVRERVGSVSEKIAVLEERVRHLPTKTWMLTMLGILIGILAGLVTLAPVLQSWFGIAGS